MHLHDIRHLLLHAVPYCMYFKDAFGVQFKIVVQVAGTGTVPLLSLWGLKMSSEV
jgi:hypothetical protein